MNSDLRNLLKLVSDGDSETHKAAFGFRGPICLSPENRKEFWENYCTLVENKTINLCLGEIPKEHFPARILLNFKYEHNTENEDCKPYTDLFLEWLAFTYQNVIEEMFEGDPETDSHLLCVALESPEPYYITEETTGIEYMYIDIELHFPYAGMSFNTFLETRNKFVRMLRNTKMMSKMTREPIGDWSSIVHIPKKSDALLMYGSSEKKNIKPLQCKKILGAIDQDDLLGEDGATTYTLDEVFFPENHEHVSDTPFELDSEKPATFWLPLFLSVEYQYKALKLKNGRVRVATKKYDKSMKNFGQFHDSKYMDPEDSRLDICEKLIAMLDIKRFATEHIWLDIGKALSTETNNGEDGVLSWIRNTNSAIKKMNKVPSFYGNVKELDKHCRELYINFTDSRITFESMCHYAAQDNPEDYAQWDKDDWCIPSMEKALSLTHSDVAEALYRTEHLHHVFVPKVTASGGRGGAWYTFQKHIWVDSPGGIFLTQSITGKFIKRYESIQAEISKEIYISEDENYKTKAQAVLKKIYALINKLKMVPYQNNIIAAAKISFYKHHFEDYLDANPDLTGFTNGVLEVVNDESIVFRNGKPEDYITMNTRIPYIKSYTKDHPLIKELMKWLKQVFLDKALLRHFLKFAASCLRGGNSDKIFPVFAGALGNNSKSMIVKLFEKTFGQYCMKLDIANFTNSSKNAASANPQLARAKGVKVAFIDEPDDDDVMKKDTFKRLSGMDSIPTRKLFDNGGDIEILLKIVMACNNPPRFASADHAVKNRFRIYPFLSEWLETPPITEEQQMKDGKFKLDPNFPKKVPKFASGFAWLISNWFSVYAEEGLIDPPIVTEYTNSYWKEHDTFGQFITDSVRVMKLEGSDKMDTTYKTAFNDICAEFRLWFKNAFPNTKIPERNILKKEFESRWGRLQGKYFVGVHLGSVSHGSVEKPITSSVSSKEIKPVAPSIKKSEKLIKPSVTKTSVINLDDTYESVVF
jgi:phage/plasmid-associated DNA primase